jgi:cell filamentation protein
MTFDPFSDFDSRGYLRNFFSSKNISKVKALEDASFQGNLDSFACAKGDRAISTLATVDFIEHKHVLDIHKILFGDV